MPVKTLLRLLPALLVSLLPFAGAAQDQTRVDPSTTERIERHNVCREVTNNTGTPIMIPHLTPEEWAAGGSAFLSNPYPNVVTALCSDGLWYWELQDLFIRRCQVNLGMSCTDYPGSGGMQITTRFTQYDNPTIYGAPDTMPVCDPDRAGERVISNQIIGTNAQTLFNRSFVCNRAAEIAPIALPDIRLEPGETGTVGQVSVSGLPHAGTEAFLAGLRYVPSGPSNEVVPTLFLNGVAGSPYDRGIPIGHITADSPYLGAFNAAYGANIYSGIGVPVRNAQTVRIQVTAPTELGTYPLFAKLGNRIANFNVIVAEPEVLPLTSGGSISSSSAYHPVFSLFQSCFGIGPGAHLSFPGACTMDSAFWDRFYTEACKPNPYGLTISMGGFNLASNGSACSVTGFDTFQSRARVSTCRPDSCAINAGGGPAACVFSCD